MEFETESQIEPGGSMSVIWQIVVGDIKSHPVSVLKVRVECIW